MYSRKGGKSGSSKPMSKKAAWISYKQKDIEEIIAGMVKRGYSSARIGLELRDRYGVPSARMVTKDKISRTMKKQGTYPDIPEDLYSLIKRAVDLISHLEKNKRDYISKRGLELTESKIRRLAKYYKSRKMLASDWKWDPEKAKLMVK